MIPTSTSDVTQILHAIERGEQAADRLLPLVKLEKEDPTAATLMKLRFFGGLTLDEAGRVLGFTERTAKRYWSFARAWLFEDIVREIER